jgi:hypothetical protein
MSTLEMPGAILHYETQGSGPVLVLRRYCRARPCLVGRCLGLGGAPANRVV